MGAYEALVLRRPALPILLAVAATGWLGWHVAHLQVDSSTDSLFMEDDPALRVYYQSRHTFGSDEYCVVAFTTGDAFSAESVALVKGLTSEFAAIHGVESVVSITSVPLFRSSKRSLPPLMALRNPVRLGDEGCDTAKARKELSQHRIYSRLLVSDDQKTTGIIVNLRIPEENQRLEDEVFALDDRIASERDAGRRDGLERERETKEARFEEVEKQRKADRTRVIRECHAIADRRATKDLVFYYSGVPVLIEDVARYIYSDILTFGGAVALVFVLTLAVLYRRLRWVLLSLGTCIVTVVWTLGAMVLAGKKITLVSSNLSSLLFIIAMAHSLHLIRKFAEEQEASPGRSDRENLREAVRHLAGPCAFTVAAMCAGFSSLIISQITPVRVLGTYLLLGVVLGYVATFVVLPSLLAALPAKRALPEGIVDGTLFLRASAKVVERLPRLTSALAVLLIAASLYGTALVKVETRLIDYFRPTTGVHQGLTFIDRHLGGTTTLEVILTNGSPGYFARPENLAKVRKVNAWLEARPEVGKVMDVASFLDELEEFFGATEAKPYPIPPPTALAMLKQAVGEKTLGGYITADQSAVRVFVRMRETSEKMDRQGVIQGLRTFLAAEPEYADLSRAPDVTGVFVLYANMIQSLIYEQVWIVLLGFSLIVLVMLGIYGSRRVRRVVAAVLFALALSVLGGMGFEWVPAWLAAWSTWVSSLFKAHVWWMLGSLLGLGILAVIRFASLRIGFISVIPNIMHILFILGSMGFSGIRLDIITIMVASVSMGISVDCAVHYLCRFRDELGRGCDYLEAMRRSQTTTGKAIFHTSLAVVLGFCTLILSNFLPTVYFGVLTALAMTSALFSCLSLVPIALLRIRPLPVVDSPPKPGAGSGV